MINELIDTLEQNVPTLNVYDKITDKVIYYHVRRHDNYYNEPEYRKYLKLHIANMQYKYTYNKTTNEIAFNNILKAIDKIVYEYVIDYDILYNICVLCGYKSEFKDAGLNGVLDCMIQIRNNKYVINYDLLHDKKFEMYLNYYYDTNINRDLLHDDTLRDVIDEYYSYYINTDVNDKMIQEHVTNLIKYIYNNYTIFKKEYNTSYLNHVIDYLKYMFNLDVELHDNELWEYIFPEEYDMFPAIMDENRYFEYVYYYCEKYDIDENIYYYELLQTVEL